MLPYENSTSGKNALEEIQKILKQFGCRKFAAGAEVKLIGQLYSKNTSKNRLSY